MAVKITPASWSVMQKVPYQKRRPRVSFFALGETEKNDIQDLPDGGGIAAGIFQPVSEAGEIYSGIGVTPLYKVCLTQHLE